MIRDTRPGAPRIAYLLKRFPRLSETFILNEILELKRTGVDLQLYALMDPGEKQVQPDARSLQPSVVYLHQRSGRLRSACRLLWGAALQMARHPAGARQVLWALLSVHRSLPSVRHAVEGLWLAGDLRRRGITHLHAHFIHSPGAVAFFARLAGGPPFSTTAHAKDLYTTLPRNIRIRGDAAEFILTCTSTNAEYLRDRLSPTAARRVAVLYHGVDLERFSPGPVTNSHRILSVGRLVPKKGFADLITALQHLNEESCEFEAEIFGGGPLHAALLAQTQTAGISDRVRFHGARTQAEIIKAYRRARLFVLAPVVTESGDRDGIPNVLVEAMACGLPVVATRVSGIPELITDGVDGLLVDPHQPEALASRLARLLTDDELATRLGRAARQKVERFFDITRSTERLRRLFAAQHNVSELDQASAEVEAA